MNAKCLNEYSDACKSFFDEEQRKKFASIIFKSREWQYSHLFLTPAVRYRPLVYFCFCPA